MNAETRTESEDRPQAAGPLTRSARRHARLARAIGGRCRAAGQWVRPDDPGWIDLLRHADRPRGTRPSCARPREAIVRCGEVPRGSRVSFFPTLHERFWGIAHGAPTGGEGFPRLACSGFLALPSE